MADVTDDAPYLVQLGALQEDAAKLLYYSLPAEGWDSCTLVFREAANYGEFVVTRTNPDGSTELVAPSNALMSAMMKLRDYMATQGKGAWLEAVMAVQRDPAKFTFDYNYNERPQWKKPPTDESYVEDLAKYPRPVDQIPDWYPRAN
ncbi:Uncharacterised protein [Mycobacteroides abscessus subsp. abscessus]|uniref:hypothetical protein n=1 Tax=Mycobacteroides abscessus TaxID=36809 RepID=UPI0009297E59|nr:hypothetical protein [Mycobacteroides abscessus]SIK63885.1 Uncharacterised protein [Mycobacteroides abscessus subsp. abscessus]